MKNSLSILITLAILLSGSSMASLDEILGQFSNLESYDEENNLCAFLSICSHLDEIIANNNAMPEAWVSQTRLRKMSLNLKIS
ncbi:MAG: hypothetical protein QS748_14035 [Candidatus Endonucleobacter bathymodioli]|uniref:Uncharacterized protein n=1 Tax=Candidatus Endonucleibacter bathymodioli TaxID=539814 RepID=A0AA90NYZ3_9GAMM|nr:hypothetical protein [Candidatus Endonucleobacter bathymodioli]